MYDLLIDKTISSDTLIMQEYGTSWLPYKDTELRREIKIEDLQQYKADLDRSWYYEARGGKMGPVSRQTIKGLFTKGTLNDNTLVWNADFGPQWRKLLSTEIIHADRGLPPPLPPSHLNNTFGWLMALVPLLGSLIEHVAKDNVTPGVLDKNWRLVNAGYFIIYVILRLADARQVEKSGRNRRSISVGSWVWLIPVYFIQRARALGQKQILFVVWLSTFVAAILIESPQLLSGKFYFGFGLPACDASSTLTQVKELFPDIPLVKVSGARAIDVSDIREVFKEEKSRSCRAKIQTSLSEEINVLYKITERDNDYLYEVNISR